MFWFSTFSAQATLNDFSFTGNLTNDDDVQLFNFSVSSPRTVTFRTWSYVGGTNADGAEISSGGFGPAIAIFDGLGNLITPPDYDYDRHVGELDQLRTLYFGDFGVFGAGEYILSLSQHTNFALGPTLADSFQGSEIINFNGNTSFWALDIKGVDNASTVPIPNAVWLFVSGLLGLFTVKKRITYIRLIGQYNDSISTIESRAHILPTLFSIATDPGSSLDS